MAGDHLPLLSAGREGQAAPHVRELLRIDPLTPAHHSLLAYWHAIRREKTEALSAYEQMYVMDPGNPFAGVLFGRMLVLLDERERGYEVLEGIVQTSPENPMVGHGRVLFHLLRGEHGEAAAALTPALQEASRYDEHLSWWMGDWLASLGREEEAVDWLKHAAVLGFFNWPVLRDIDTFLDPIRDGPIFGKFLEEIRAKWEAFDALQGG